MDFGLNPGITNTGVTDFNCDNLGLLVAISINPVSFAILLYSEGVTHKRIQGNNLQSPRSFGKTLKTI